MKQDRTIAWEDNFLWYISPHFWTLTATDSGTGTALTTHGGGVRLGNASDARIEDNFIEGHVGDTGSHGASLDLDGNADGPCSNAIVSGNLIVPIDPYLDCIRVNRAHRTLIGGIPNTLIRPGPPPSTQIRVTSLASKTHVGRNNYDPDGDSVLSGLADQGVGTTHE